MADNQSVPMPPHIKAELARLRALMIPDAEAYRRREIGSKRMEEEAKKIQPLRPLSAADTDLEYLPAAKGGVIDMDRMRLELMGKAKGGRSSPFKKSKAQYVVYHGTNRNFNTFDPNAKSNTQGGEELRGTGAHFFTPNKELANAYTGASKSETTGKYHAWPPESIHGGNVMPVYLNMVNPLDIDAEGKMYHQVEHHVKDAKRKGHDSVILRNVVDQPGAAGSLQTHKHDAHIVFNPNQIKSAIGNRGTYDINDPDITKAKGGSVKEPKNTVKAYKLFRVHPKHPGKLFPLFVNANEPVEMNKWVDAKEGEMAGDKVKSKIGPLAYRPGWHAGDLPVATHIGEKSDPNLTAPDVRPANHVWAEVEMPHDVDWQSVANERGMNPKGKLIARNAHITDQIPKGGHYRYKTNSNMTGNWLIGGSMKVNRVLQDKEVKAINKAAGASDLPRTRPFKAKDYGLAKGGVVAPEEFMAEEHVNYMAKGGSRIASIKEIEDYIRQKRGEHAAKRVQRAADEIPGLENMYTPEALQHTFERQNAGLMSMNPAEFEKFAERMREDITRKDSKRKTRNDEVLPFDSYLNHLAQLKGGFDEVPFLELGHRDPEYLPSIEGHEGRHRSRALSGKGVKKSLVQLMPAARMSLTMPKRNSEKLVQKLNQTLGKDRFVSPEGGGLLPSDQTAGMYNWLREKKLLEANRPQLPEVYKSGGATHAHHLDIEERPL